MHHQKSEQNETLKATVSEECYDYQPRSAWKWPEERREKARGREGGRERICELRREGMMKQGNEGVILKRGREGGREKACNKERGGEKRLA